MHLRQTTSNDHNVNFYNAINLRTFTASAGLDSCPDLETMEAALTPDRGSMKVLEVGAGYGRVVRWLLGKGYGKVVAIERSVAADEIERRQADEVAAGRLEFLRQDVRDLATEERFDLILWMFSGISDFSPEEQHRVLGNLAKHLAPGGQLVLDLPPTQRSNATRVEGKTQVIEIPGLPTYHGTVPTVSDIEGLAQRLGFAQVEQIPYQPLSGQPERDRVLYVLSECAAGVLSRVA